MSRLYPPKYVTASVPRHARPYSDAIWYRISVGRLKWNQHGPLMERSFPMIGGRVTDPDGERLFEDNRTMKSKWRRHGYFEPATLRSRYHGKPWPNNVCSGDCPEQCRG